MPDDLARSLYERAATVGLRPVAASWEYLPVADRDRWRALADVVTTPSAGQGFLTRLIAIEQLQQAAIREQGEMTTTLTSLLLIGESMSAELDRIKSSVERNGGVIDSGITLIKGLAEEIRQLRAEPERLTALADSLDAKADALAKAIAENTPAAPAPVPVPAPAPAPNP